MSLKFKRLDYLIIQHIELKYLTYNVGRDGGCIWVFEPDIYEDKWALWGRDNMGRTGHWQFRQDYNVIIDAESLHLTSRRPKE